jgi:hypothetical protein
MKTLLYLGQFPFSEHHHYKFEFDLLQKNFKHKVIVHDLSSILINIKLISIWKTKLYKKSKRFKSLGSWIREFKKLKKIKNLIIYDNLTLPSFKVIIIKLFLKNSGFTIIKHDIDTMKLWESKKNYNYFIEKILFHKFNIKLYLQNFKQLFFEKINIYNFLIKYNKEFILTNKNTKKNLDNKNKKYINIHTYDYSNSIYAKKYNYKKKYIIFIDNGGPYFVGDADLTHIKTPKNDIPEFYKSLNLFFLKLEKLFKAKIIIIPHAKYKISNLKKSNINPYLRNRESDNNYDAVGRLSKNCLFAISRGSTAIMYPVINFKPNLIVYKSKYNYYRNDILLLKSQCKTLGTELIDIDNFDKQKILKNLKVNKKKFIQYKNKYVVAKNVNEKKANFKIIGELLNKID